MAPVSKAEPASPAREPTRPTTQVAEPASKSTWETPKMQDVSEQVMAQPYIRFT